MDMTSVLFNQELSIRTRRLLLKEQRLDKKAFDRLLCIFVCRLDFSQPKTRRVFTTLLSLKSDEKRRLAYISSPARFALLFGGSPPQSNRKPDGASHQADVCAEQRGVREFEEALNAITVEADSSSRDRQQQQQQYGDTAENGSRHSTYSNFLDA